MNALFLLAIVTLFGAGPQTTHKQSEEINEDEIRNYLAKKVGCRPDDIHFATTEQHDFLKVGYEQAVVVASTCMTGTAGPDVHSVYTRDEHGKLKELEFQEPKLPQQVLFGNPNSGYSVEGDVLVDTYYDSSGRDTPLVIKYRWDKQKQKFVAVQIDAAKPYRTSYDCSKAKETALAICYVESLADLDVQLGKLYKAYLAGLNPDSKEQAIEEERHWIAERDKSCAIYKFWVECLDDSYKGRIGELQKRLAPSTATH